MYISQICAVLNVQLANMSHVYVHLTNMSPIAFSSTICPMFMYISQICAVLNVQLTNMSHVYVHLTNMSPVAFSSTICPMFMYISQTCLLLHSAQQYVPCLTYRLQNVSYFTCLFNIYILLTKLSNFCFVAFYLPKQ